jgi:hypothetical protein
MSGVKPVRQSLKFMSWKNTHYLRKNGATMWHGLELLGVVVFFGEIIITLRGSEPSIY